MGLEHSKSKGNERLEGSIKERDATHHDTRELGDEKETFPASDKLYDAFIQPRSPDVAFALYHSLEEKGFSTFLDDQESQLRDVIYFSKVQIAIFTPCYAESPCCLDDLVSMLKTKALFIPVFCDVEPVDLRYTQKGVYEAAFAGYLEKGRFSNERIQQWMCALKSSSVITGYQFSTSNDDVEMLCAEISKAVQKVVGKTSSETVASADKKLELGHEKGTALGDDVFITASGKRYDVFINHRGPDVRKTLACALYRSLREKGISAFLADHELQLGDVIHSTIQDAILSSTIFIAIFSPRFAESRWCLDELLVMQETNALFIPVFYHVSPSDLRFTKRGVYGSAFARHQERGRFGKERIRQWKDALHSSSFISGYVINTYNEDNVEELCAKIALAVKQEIGKTS